MSFRLSFKKAITGALVFGLLLGVTPVQSLTALSEKNYASSINGSVIDESESGTVADFVERLYTVALGRPSEATGKAFWVKELENGNRTGGDCGVEFLCSEEMTKRNLSNEDFVEVLYKTFFDRASEPNGKGYWVGELNSNKKTRKDVVLGFIDSKEWCNVCATYGVKSGAPTAKATIPSKNATDFATRLYTCCLKRDPEQAGLEYWSLALTNLEKTGAGAAQLFFELPEFIGFKTDDKEYITRLYTTFMDREPEEGGMDYWMSKLKNGTSRREVMAGFASSPEFTDICKKYAIERGEIDMNAPEPKDPSITPTPTLPSTPRPTPPEGMEYYWFGNGPVTIKVFSASSEINTPVESFINADPEFGEKYTVWVQVKNNTSQEYETTLNAWLTAGGDTSPDIYTAEAAYVLPYTKGDFAPFAASYQDLIPNLEDKVKDGQIATYTTDVGVDQNNNLKGLCYTSSSGAFIYRRSIAKEVFGSDDIATVGKAIGSGTQSWDKFLEAAEALKNKGYSIISGAGDIYNVITTASQKPWVIDNKLYIDPMREAFLDLGKTIWDKDYSNKTDPWTPEWYEDLSGSGDKQVFGFFGPAWFVNYVLGNACGNTFGDWAVCNPNVGFWWGGTWVMANKQVLENGKKEAVAQLLEYITLDCSKDGFQYKYANGLLGEEKIYNCVPSQTVMAMSHSNMALLGGQDIFPIYNESIAYCSGRCLSFYDSILNSFFYEVVNKYSQGALTRAEALQEFKDYARECDIEI